MIKNQIFPNITTIFMDFPYYMDMESNTSSILLEFRAQNVFSFKDRFVISFEPSVDRSSKSVRKVEVKASKRTSKATNEIGYLPAVGIFGANAAGKSNVLKALAQMRWLVQRSRSIEPGASLPQSPFRGDETKNPTSFQVIFISNGIRYEYGFEYSETAVNAEWAFWYPNGVRSLLFERDGMNVKASAVIGTGISYIAKNILPPNALLLSMPSQVERTGLREIYDWFSNGIKGPLIQPSPIFRKNAVSFLESSSTNRAFVNFVTQADLGIVDAEIQEEIPGEREKHQQIFSQLVASGLIQISQNENSDSTSLEYVPGIKFKHRFKNALQVLDSTEESNGTHIWLEVAGWAFEALTKGGIFLVDEIDRSLHPILVNKVIDLFQDAKKNVLGAQLIFTGHNLLSMDSKNLEFPLTRDQIQFVEKNEFGVSTIFPLSDAAKLSEEAVLKRYLAGLYGATPKVSFTQFNLG